MFIHQTLLENNFHNNNFISSSNLSFNFSNFIICLIYFSFNVFLNEILRLLESFPIFALISGIFLS